MASERRLIVTQCRQVTSGVGRNQKPYTIYELEATREDHTPISEEMKLRSFEDMPIGVPVDVTIERFNSDKYGVSYTVKLKGGGQGSPQAQINALAQRVSDLEEKLQAMAERVYSATGPPSAPSSSAAPKATPADGIPKDDDIPF